MSASQHPAPARLAQTCRTGGVRLLLACTALLLGGGSGGVWAEEATSREYMVKAAFVFSFAHFVAWPQATTPPEPQSAPLRIGVLGDDPFGAALDETVRNEAVQGRKITIARSHSITDLTDCQILFISRSEEDHLASILQHLENKPVLSISDMDGFAEHGGVIRLYVIGKKVRFEINQGVAIKDKLKLDSQLLSLGKVIGPHPGTDRGQP